MAQGKAAAPQFGMLWMLMGIIGATHINENSGGANKIYKMYPMEQGGFVWLGEDAFMLERGEEHMWIPFAEFRREMGQGAECLSEQKLIEIGTQLFTRRGHRLLEMRQEGRRREQKAKGNKKPPRGKKPHQ